jgi:hypothetical protein
MANNYIHAAFAVTVTASEAQLIAAVETAITAIEDDLQGDDRRAAYEALGSAFADAFPPISDDPFSGVMRIFPDKDFPCLDATITIEDCEDDTTSVVTFSGDQFGIEQIANLLFACAKSALPIGFEYAYTCDKLRNDEFGGGAVIITADGIEYHSTHNIVRGALSPESGDDKTRLLLATRDAEHGLLFWNNTNGFGDLASATLFTEKDAASFAVPIAFDEPEWLACPAGVS